MHHDGVRVRVLFRRWSGDHSRNDCSILENNTQSTGPPPPHSRLEVCIAHSCRGKVSHDMSFLRWGTQTRKCTYTGDDVGRIP